MNFFKQQQNTSGYNSIPNAIAAADTAVPLGTTILPSPTTMMTMDCRLLKWMVAIVAAVAMMLVAYGAVLMQDGSWYTAAAEGLVVATQECAPCLIFLRGVLLVGLVKLSIDIIYLSKLVFNSETRPHTVGPNRATATTIWGLDFNNVTRTQHVAAHGTPLIPNT